MSDYINKPSDEELARMSREELVELGGRMDGVETVFKENRWPVEGTKAEKRAERGVALWLLFGGLMGPSTVHRLLNPTLMIALTLIGSITNTILFKKTRTPFVRFLLVGPWFVLAAGIAYLFPAGEWVLAISGLTAAIFAFLLQFTAEETLQIYQPKEYLTAAADVIPIFFVSAWQGWTGQN